MATPPSDQLPNPSPTNPSPNSNPNSLSNQKPNLNGLNQVPGNTNSAPRVFPSPAIPLPPSSPIPPPTKAPTAQQLLPRIQESLAAHGAVCPSLSSSSRVVRPSADQVVTVVNPAFFNGNPAVVGVHQVHGFAPSFVAAAAAAVGDPAVRVLRSPPPQQRPVMPVRTVPKHASVAGPPRIGASVVHKVTPFSAAPSPSDLNNYKDMREKNGENAVTVVINDRKVRLLDGAPSSLYALCRSWVQNDMPQEIQPQFGEGLKLLPRPLPINTRNNAIPKKVEGDADEDDEFASQNQDLSTGKKIGGGHEKDGIYFLDTPAESASVVDASSNALQWHLRLGHPSLPKLRQLCPQILSTVSIQCEACQLG